MGTTTLLDLAYQRLLSEQEVVLWQSERAGAGLVVEDELHSAAGTIGLVLIDNDDGDLVVGPVNNPPLR